MFGMRHSEDGEDILEEQSAAWGRKQRKLNEGSVAPLRRLDHGTTEKVQTADSQAHEVVAVRSNAVGDVEATLQQMADLRGLECTKRFVSRVKFGDGGPPSDLEMRGALEEAWEENERIHRASRAALLSLFRRHDHLAPAWVQCGVARRMGAARRGQSAGTQLQDLPDSLICQIYGLASGRVCSHLSVCRRFRTCLLRSERVDLRVWSANGAEVTAESLLRFPTGVSLTAKCCHGVLPPVLQALDQGWCALTALDLSDNNIGDAGTARLCQALMHNTGLTSLSLGDNCVSQAGAASIASALRALPRLVKISLAGNRILSAGASEIATALSCTRLRLTSLSLSGGAIGIKGAAAVGSALIPRAGELPSLLKLDLSACDLRAEGVQELVPALRANPQLRVLSLSRNEMEGEGATSLAAALGTCLQELNLNFNDLG